MPPLESWDHAEPLDAEEFEEESARDQIVDVEAKRSSNVHAAAQRARRSDATALGVACAVLSFVVLGSLGFGAWTLLGAVAVASVAGVTLGSLSRRYYCSSCNQRVSKLEPRCAGCAAELTDSTSGAEDESSGEDDAESFDAPYFEDPSIPEEEKAEARILTAILFGWVLERGLATPEVEAAEAKLMGDLKRGLFPAEELFSAWERYEDRYLGSSAEAFTASYFDETGAWNPEDYALLTTATSMRPTRACYERVAALLDVRWAAADSG